MRSIRKFLDEEGTAIALPHRTAWVLVGAFAAAASVEALSAPPAPASAPTPAARPAQPLTVAANLMVDRDLTIGTRVDGVIESIEADRGTLVKKGQPLATMDQREFDLDRRAAEETLKVSLTDFRRYEELHRQELASQAELEQKKAQYELARVEAEKAKLVIDRSVIRAPFDGVVVERFARVGQKVLIDENVPLFRVAALEPLLARVYLPEGALATVRPGSRVSVTAPEFPGVASVGKVSFVSPVTDAASGTVETIVEVAPDARRVLRPGMAVEILFPKGR